jgi:hypothetical protein
MFHSNLKCFVFLAVLLPSVNVLAASTITPENAQATNNQATQTTKTIKWNKSTYTESSNARSSSTTRAFTDDYERLHRTVTQPRPTTPVWLGNKNRAGRPELPKTLWLGKKNRSK